MLISELFWEPPESTECLCPWVDSATVTNYFPGSGPGFVFSAHVPKAPFLAWEGPCLLRSLGLGAAPHSLARWHQASDSGLRQPAEPAHSLWKKLLHHCWGGGDGNLPMWGQQEAFGNHLTHCALLRVWWKTSSISFSLSFFIIFVLIPVKYKLSNWFEN